MKKAFLILLAAIFLWSSSGYCLDFCFRYCARTGDKEFDLSMGNLNMEARSDMNNFIEDLSISFGRPRVEVENLIYVVRMQPADAFLAFKISRIIKKPITVVVDEYKANRGKGWGVIAQRLGIKPGSSEFHALKQGIVDKLIVIKEKKAKVKVRVEEKQQGKGKGR